MTDSLTSFRHHLWRGHPDPEAWQGLMPQVLGTNGHSVRWMQAEDKQIILSRLEDAHLAKRTAQTVEGALGRGRGLRGYASFEPRESLALWQSSDGGVGAWIAMPFEEDEAFLSAALRWQTLGPETVRERVRLIGGASLVESGGRATLWCAVESRADAGHPLWEEALEAVTGLGLRATLPGPGEPRETRVVRATRQLLPPQRQHPGRLEAAFELDPTLWSQYREAPGLTFWLVVALDARWMGVPEGRNQLWFAVAPAQRRP